MKTKQVILVITGFYVLGFQEVVVGGGVVVSQPQLCSELLRFVDDVHGGVGFEGAAV